jgi:hypothetical protein
LHKYVSGSEDRGAIGNDPSALVCISRIRIAGSFASGRLDNHFESSLREGGNNAGNKRNPALSGIAFLRNSNNHAVVLSPGRIVARGPAA